MDDPLTNRTVGLPAQPERGHSADRIQYLSAAVAISLIMSGCRVDITT